MATFAGDWPTYDMMLYASWTSTRLNREAMARHGIGLLFEPSQLSHRGHWRRPCFDDCSGWWPYVLDNGRWGTRHDVTQWSEYNFWMMVSSLSEWARWLVIPDLPPPIDDDDEGSIPDGHGERSLLHSINWMNKLSGAPCQTMIAVQDQMTVDMVRPYLSESTGIFIGGTSSWKERTAPRWGRLSKEVGCPFHMGRVNTKRRLRIAYSAGCETVDGTNPTLWAYKAPLMTRQMCEVIEEETNQYGLFGG